MSQDFEFHFARNSAVTRAAFFAALPHFIWSGAVLLVDKQQLPAEFTRMHNPAFYGFFLGHLLARAPLHLIEVKRLLVDDSVKDSAIVRGMRIAASPVLRARGMRRTPKLRGEPAHRWDGLQVADMLAGAVVERENTGRNYLRGLRNYLRVYRYEVEK
jgi:hypothetical protein